MSQSSSKQWRFIAGYVLLPLIIAKVVWSFSLFFLEKGSIEERKSENYSYHYRLNLASKIIGGVNMPVEPVHPGDDDGEQIKNMKLKGTYLGGDASFMIIEDGGKSDFIYIGEEYKGYELVKVSERKVGLKKNGKNYYVVLSDEENSPSASTYHDSQTEMHQQRAPGEPAVISHRELKEYIKDPNKIWKNIRIQEQRNNGQISGFRVNYVKKGSFFDTSGLKSGDVIKRIDGNEIKSLADVMQYYTNVDSLDSLSLTVERGGNELELDFSVN